MDTDRLCDKQQSHMLIDPTQISFLTTSTATTIRELGESNKVTINRYIVSFIRF